MNNCLQLTLIAVYATFYILITTSTAIASDVLVSAPATSLSSDVRHALDSVYLAAKDANMINPAGDASNQAKALESNENVVKSSRDPIMQMVAVGLGVSAAMMVMNYLSGGTSTSSSFSGFSSAMLGGMLGDYAYRKYYAPPLPSVPAGVAQRIVP